MRNSAAVVVDWSDATETLPFMSLHSYNSLLIASHAA